MSKDGLDKQIADIIDQGYKGTNEVVSSLGYGAVETKAGLLAGVPLGAAIGAALPNNIEKADKYLRDSIPVNVDKLRGHSGIKGFFAAPARWTLQASNWVLGVADKTSRHAFNSIPPNTSEKIQKFIGRGDMAKGKARFIGAMKGGTLGAAAGFVIASFTGTAHGALVAHDGRKQFEKAKNEIKDLRHENHQLKDQLTALQEHHAASATPSNSIDAGTAEIDARREDKSVAADQGASR